MKPSESEFEKHTSLESCTVGSESLPGSDETTAISVNDLTYRYPNESVGLIDISLRIPAGARVVCVGRNGAGKSTLLAILAGRKMVARNRVAVLGRCAFHDPTLIWDVGYIAEPWRTEHLMDITVKESMADVIHSPRFSFYRKILGVELEWHIARLSSGQRRLCQLLAHLAAPKKIFLLDEALSDLDIVARDKLLTALMAESKAHNITVVYATHCLDGIESWASHILCMEQSRVKHFCTLTAFPGYSRHNNEIMPTSLYSAVRDDQMKEQGNIESSEWLDEVSITAALERHLGAKDALVTFIERSEEPKR